RFSTNRRYRSLSVFRRRPSGSIQNCHPLVAPPRTNFPAPDGLSKISPWTSSRPSARTFAAALYRARERRVVPASTSPTATTWRKSIHEVSVVVVVAWGGGGTAGPSGTGRGGR